MERENREVFARLGLKSTKHRDGIYELLKAADRPLAPEEIFLRLKETDATVSYSTVYRTLDTFTAKGLAVKSAIGDENRAVFELNRPEHRHRLICIGCRKTIPLEHCPLDRYEKSLERETSFDITAHRLELFGYCPACKGNGH